MKYSCCVHPHPRGVHLHHDGLPHDDLYGHDLLPPLHDHVHLSITVKVLHYNSKSLPSWCSSVCSI